MAKYKPKKVGHRTKKIEKLSAADSGHRSAYSDAMKKKTRRKKGAPALRGKASRKKDLG